MLKEFREFISRGSVIDLAIGVILGAAFTAIVTSIVDDIFMPLIGVLLGGTNLDALSITVGDASIAYGNFLSALINFLLVALFLFFVVRSINAMKRLKEEEKTQEPESLPEPSEEVKLLTEIRDLLKKDI